MCSPPTIVPDISKYHQYSKHHFYPHRSLVYPLACTVRPRCERVLCDLFMLRHTAESKLTSPNIKNLIQFKILYSSLNLKFYFTTHLIADPSSHSYSYIYSTSNETVKLSKHFSLREGCTKILCNLPLVCVIFVVLPPSHKIPFDKKTISLPPLRFCISLLSSGLMHSPFVTLLIE